MAVYRSFLPLHSAFGLSLSVLLSFLLALCFFPLFFYSLCSCLNRPLPSSKEMTTKLIHYQKSFVMNVSTAPLGSTCYLQNQLLFNHVATIEHAIVLNVRT